MARKKAKPPKPITSTKHKDKRTNIPTEELRDFVAGDEHAPETILCPRDPSLDLQLVWQGKDEQEALPAANRGAWGSEGGSDQEGSTVNTPGD